MAAAKKYERVGEAVFAKIDKVVCYTSSYYSLTWF